MYLIDSGEPSVEVLVHSGFGEEIVEMIEHPFDIQLQFPRQIPRISSEDRSSAGSTPFFRSGIFHFFSGPTETDFGLLFGAVIES